MNFKDLWVSVLKRLQPTIKKANFNTWFQNTAVIKNEEGVLTVGVPTSFAKDWIKSKYLVKVLQAAQEIDSKVKEIEIEVVSRLSEKDATESVDLSKFEGNSKKKVRKIRNENEVTVSKRGSFSNVTSQRLNDRYSLSNYVVGLDNRLPHAASTAVSKMPGGIYNPLYIYGEVGLGKTHLLQAIGNETLSNFPDLVVKYITAEKFVTDVVEAIGKRHMQKFKDQYRNVDVLLIDDIQFFARKNSSQQEFFHTFNALYDKNKQIVLTSDRPPSELQDIDERLMSRFGMGMVVELMFPDFETRVAILQQKCQEFEVLIDPSVIEFIANNVHNNVRELEGVLRQAVAEAELEDKVPTIHSVARIIKRLNKAQKIIGYDIEAKRNGFIAKTIDDVMDIVSNYYEVTVDDLKGKGRKKEIMIPRQVCMYIIKNELGHSYEKIGDDFGGRNHTTVMHACNKLSKKVKSDLRLVRDINAIKREMGM